MNCSDKVSVLNKVHVIYNNFMLQVKFDFRLKFLNLG